MVLLRWGRIMKNTNKWELSALASSCSLDERTAVQRQTNGLYFTSWGRHHNTVLCSESCIRGTQCHQGALWRYGFLSACSCKECTELASRPTFRWWIGEKDPVHQIYTQEPHCQGPSVVRHALSHWFWYDIIFIEQRECISFENLSAGFLSRTLTMYLVILVQLMLIWWKLYSLSSVC